MLIIIFLEVRTDSMVIISNLWCSICLETVQHDFVRSNKCPCCRRPLDGQVTTEQCLYNVNPS